jgi:tRNA dimethylallyltransferase
MNSEQKGIVVILGPTATGKSKLAIKLGKRLPIEIVNADAYSLYKGMDIGTGKVSKEEQKLVPHHMLDILEVSQKASVAEYQKVARQKIDEISDRGNIPVLVGGSGLYIHSIINNSSFPPRNDKIRKSIENDEKDIGLEQLYNKLEKLDPNSAALIGPYNSRRIIRALEVIQITGKNYQAKLNINDYYYKKICLLGLLSDREYLDERINIRVDKMREFGLTNEVRGLQKDISVTASRAIGYKEILEYLKDISNNKINENEAYEFIKLHTRQLVRKQFAWFNRDKNINWFDIKNLSTEKIMEKITSK